MIELYKLIQDLRDFFSEFDNFQSCTKKPVGGVSS